MNTIPKPNEFVKWNEKLFVVISVDMGGKCKIKQFTTTRRISKIFSGVDISELRNVSNAN